MSEWTKTILFVVAAGVSVGLAAAAQTLSRPSALKEFERVGEPFYADFQDPLAARTLEVVTYDDATSVINQFHVRWGKDGWTISPYGYPADAENQLEKTASSLIGVERAGLASRREGDHERFGVIDPLSEDATKLKGRGKRITLKDEKGQVIADYIFGSAVEGRDGYYYVRTPKEKETYISKVDLNLSTRFADWIESDLLKVSSSDLRTVRIHDYSLDEERGRITGGQEHVLVRGEDFGPWKLEGLDEATEQVNTANVNALTRVLDELKIIGVRPKPKGLNPDLSLDPKIINNQVSADLLQESLADKGFFLAQDQEGKLRLVAKEGQLTALTSQGVAYEIYFGDQFSGSLFDLEFGDAKDANKPKRLKDDESKKSETGRYVFIAARLDESQLGAAPTPPAEPTPPADASEEDKKKAEDAAKKAQADYDSAKKAHEQKAADAKKRVEELNGRFQAWYYVISTENFQDLKLSRDALVSPKEEPKPGAATPPAGGSSAPVEAPKPAATSSPGDAAGPPRSET
jgi:Domain of unknown function (DUF4340)